MYIILKLFLGGLADIDVSVVASIASAVNDYARTFFRAKTVTMIDMDNLRLLIECGEKVSVMVC